MQLRSLLSVCIILITAGYGVCQPGWITGAVTDSKTKEPLPLATVFINSTTLATASSVSGQYSLKNIPAGPVEVVVSYIGYESSRTKLIMHDGDRLLLNIHLVPSAQELPNVQITGERDKDWKKQYQRFEKVFLGENSTGAKIINPGVIDFKEQDRGRTLLAKSTEPIEIENPGLGYHIFYYLQKFQSDKKEYMILGDQRFQQMDVNDATKTSAWIRNRKTTYEGSVRHLLVSLINHRAPEEGFQLFVDLPGFDANTRSATFSANKGVVLLNPDSVVTPGDKAGEFRIRFKQRVEVHYVNKVAGIKTYKDIPCPVGWIEPMDGDVVVNAQGVIINLNSVVTSGYLSEARVASQLPDDYRP